MSNQIGRKVEAAIAFESSRGVGIAPKYALGKVDFSLYDKTVDVRNDNGVGRIEDSLEKFVVEKYAQGSIGGVLGANSALYLLGLAFGGTPTVGAAADSTYPWTLTMSNTAQHVSGSLVTKDVNQTLIHKLLMLEQLEISVDVEDAVRYDAEFVSKVGRVSGQTIPTYVDDKAFTKRKTKIYLATNVAGLAAAARQSIKEFKLTIKKNLTRDSGIGTAEPEDIFNQSFSIEGEMKLNYTDQTVKNLMMNGTYNALRVKFESENLIGSSTYGDVILDFSKVDFFSWEPDAPNDELVTNTINFKANYDLTNGLLNAATIHNALSAA